MRGDLTWPGLDDALLDICRAAGFGESAEYNDALDADPLAIAWWLRENRGKP